MISSLENRGGIRYMPMAFTEQGVAMLSKLMWDTLLEPPTKKSNPIGFHVR